MGRLAEARGVLFELMALRDFRWPSGEVHVPAGTMGQAVLAWGGERPGWMVEWEGHVGICAVGQREEGEEWVKVSKIIGNSSNCW